MRRAFLMVLGGLFVALVLAACADSVSFPASQVTSVSVVGADGSFTVQGSGFYQHPGGTGMRIEACGTSISASIVAAVASEILLPPAGHVVVEVGETLSAVLPVEGVTPGVSDVRVIRPDGQVSVFEDAITCAVAPEPDPEPEPEPEPDPEPVVETVASLSAEPVSGHAPLLVTFGAAGSEGEGELVYAWDFGTGDEATTATASYTYSTPGEYTVTLTVSSESGSDTATQAISVIQAPVVTGISVEVEELLYLGESAQATATVTALGGADESVTWSSSDASVLVVSASGLIIAVGVGEAEVVSTSAFDASVEGRLRVRVGRPLVGRVVYVYDYLNAGTVALDAMRIWADGRGDTVVTTTIANLEQTLAEDADLVYYHSRSLYVTAATATTLSRWVTAGGRLVFGDWYEHTPAVIDLAAELGVTFSGTRNQSSFTVLDPQMASGLSTTTLAVHATRATYALGLTPHEGTQVLAEFNDGTAALVLGNHGRTAMFGVLPDSFDPANANQFFQNLFERLLPSTPRPAPR